MVNPQDFNLVQNGQNVWARIGHYGQHGIVWEQPRSYVACVSFHGGACTGFSLAEREDVEEFDPRHDLDEGILCGEHHQIDILNFSLTTGGDPRLG